MLSDETLVQRSMDYAGAVTTRAKSDVLLGLVEKYGSAEIIKNIGPMSVVQVPGGELIGVSTVPYHRTHVVHLGTADETD